MQILVTAGPTREYFDSVRFISNPSSGKMGYAIAAEAAGRDHDVVLVSGPVELPEPEGVRMVHVVSAREMFESVTSLFAQCHCLVMTAAVCDYRPSKRQPHKLKKRGQVRAIHLQPTEDILTHVGKVKGDRVVIGFAMEDHDHHKNAESKLRRKRCDAIVLNDLGNVGTESGTIEVLQAGQGWLEPTSGTKAQLAVTIVDIAESLYRQSHRQ